ncbi:ABC transporter substrate-binding protein [Parafrankia sp. EUN1f]|uniref:ABC transporter substrate-binding protein n=1 Tax=Parafrankia sp. EUN1f TaxID=102897 RepID=UPI0001C44D87|nr:ABC transporter substrate-binding protein [Parafrankia sp. EUN1f]EFC85299.1 ABC-type branched-chain amino acid transport systems periplasmic component-like protein [Parafrankia sp. EUN1f]
MDQTSSTAGLGMAQGVRRMVAVVAVAALTFVGAGCGSSDKDDSKPPVDASVLGPDQVATGTPIKFGVVSDGQTPAFDNTIQLDAAEAVTKYLNQHRNGVGGHPIELVTCETQNDPSKASDCANQFVRENITLAVFGEIATMAPVWKPLHDAKIPVFTYATTEAEAILDKDSTFVLASQIAGLADVAIGVAKANKIKKVTAVVIDVPQATAFYDAVGKQVFADAGIDLKVVKVPVGTADMSSQMAEIASGGPTEVHIIGNDAFCIAAFNGLRAMSFDGPISVLNQCVSDSSRKAIGSYLEGVSMGSPLAIGDNDNKDLKLWNAIVATYGKEIDLSNSMGPTIFMTMMALYSALDGITGDVTPESVIAKIKAAGSLPVPASGDLTFRCNGKAYALTPAVCIRGTLLTTLDEDGNPTLPYRATGNSPVED